MTKTADRLPLLRFLALFAILLVLALGLAAMDGGGRGSATQPSATGSKALAGSEAGQGDAGQSASR